ncbi:MAG TPA: hypothetical protein VEY92_11375 [Pseudoxanthomonas sp.]|nr:hypothetical protein [Pseudoxanthomonas sp.]
MRAAPRRAVMRPNPSARQALLRARAELYSDEPGYTTEQTLAERERLRLEDEAKRVRQQVLTLRAAP